MGFRNTDGPVACGAAVQAWKAPDRQALAGARAGRAGCPPVHGVTLNHSRFTVRSGTQRARSAWCSSRCWHPCRPQLVYCSLMTTSWTPRSSRPRENGNNVYHIGEPGLESLKIDRLADNAGGVVPETLVEVRHQRHLHGHW